MSVAPGRRSAGIMVIILGQITTSKGALWRVPPTPAGSMGWGRQAGCFYQSHFLFALRFIDSGVRTWNAGFIKERLTIIECVNVCGEV